MELWSLFLRVRVETNGECHRSELTWGRGGPLGPDVCAARWTGPREAQLRLPGNSGGGGVAVLLAAARSGLCGPSLSSHVSVATQGLAAAGGPRARAFLQLPESRDIFLVP